MLLYTAAATWSHETSQMLAELAASGDLRLEDLTEEEAGGWFGRDTVNKKSGFLYRVDETFL